MVQQASSSAQELLNKVTELEGGLIAYATGRKFYNEVYEDLRRELIGCAEVKSMVPVFVHRNRDLAQFWDFIKPEYGTYRERRVFIRDQFRPLIDYLESKGNVPGIAPITDALVAFDSDHVHAVWQKALDRRTNDPEGAITAARTLLETLCKHILDDLGSPYPNDIDLPRLWTQVAEKLNLAPAQHQVEIFRSILGNCQSIVNNLAAIRNRAGDAHGQGRRQVRPKPRHAELAVNLAGAMASFLVRTWEERSRS